MKPRRDHDIACGDLGERFNHGRVLLKHDTYLVVDAQALPQQGLELLNDNRVGAFRQRRPGKDPRGFTYPDMSAEAGSGRASGTAPGASERGRSQQPPGIAPGFPDGRPQFG